MGVSWSDVGSYLSKVFDGQKADGSNVHKNINISGCKNRNNLTVARNNDELDRDVARRNEEG